LDEIEVAIAPIPGAELFKVDVVRSRAGEASAVVAFDAEMLLERRAELQRAVLASAVRSRAVLSEIERPLREVGAMLFSALLRIGEVGGRYTTAAALAADQGQGLRVMLRTDSALLAALPWEAMYDDVVGAYVVAVHWAPTATWAELQDLLLSQDWHVVHFIGHGDFDSARDEGILALVGENGRADLVEANRRPLWKTRLCRCAPSE